MVSLILSNFPKVNKDTLTGTFTNILLIFSQVHFGTLQTMIAFGCADILINLKSTKILGLIRYYIVKHLTFNLICFTRKISQWIRNTIAFILNLMKVKSGIACPRCFLHLTFSNIFVESKELLRHLHFFYNIKLISFFSFM